VACAVPAGSLSESEAARRGLAAILTAGGKVGSVSELAKLLNLDVSSKRGLAARDGHK
jgi:hypothetical protein